jgi:hypothetical protein
MRWSPRRSARGSRCSPAAASTSSRRTSPSPGAAPRSPSSSSTARARRRRPASPWPRRAASRSPARWPGAASTRRSCGGRVSSSAAPAASATRWWAPTSGRSSGTSSPRSPSSPVRRSPTPSTAPSSASSCRPGRWARSAAAAALDVLADAAAQQLGAEVTWRILGDGSIWLGPETWPAATLPASAEVIDPSPLVPFTVIACEVPALLPGVDLAGVGRVVLAEHWVRPNSVRSWAWT